MSDTVLDKYEFVPKDLLHGGDGSNSQLFDDKTCPRTECP